jgi:Fur family zinc uptake transcriptional regulator
MAKEMNNDGECDDSRSSPDGLTKNESLVWSTLSGVTEPMKAYEILDQLKSDGVRAPMTVYRALDGLEQKGLIHKLEAQNAFVVCKHEGPHEVQVFLVCESCASVKEIDIDALEPIVGHELRRIGFRMTTARLEVRGVCAACPDPEPAVAHA